MVLSQEEVNGLTRKRYGTKEALTDWFAQVDALVSAPTFPTYYWEIARPA